jgi:hypothetical protein
LVSGYKETAVEEKPRCAGCMAFSAVLRTLDPFSQSTTPFPLKMCCLSPNLRLSLTPSVKHMHCYLAFWGSFALWEADFHKMRGRETADHTMVYN